MKEIEEIELLSMCKILGLFFNIITADDKYFLHNLDNLTQQTHMQLSKKQKKNSHLFSPFFKSRLNFEHLERKYEPCS